MTFDELVRRVAIRETITQTSARRLVTQLFDDIKSAVLIKEAGRVNIPQFGVFSRRAQKPTTRPVGGVPTKIRASTRVIFRAGSGAKRLE